MDIDIIKQIAFVLLGAYVGVLCSGFYLKLIYKRSYFEIVKRPLFILTVITGILVAGVIAWYA